MGYCISIFTFFFLFCGILTQAIGYLTANMHENTIINERHGIYQHCLLGRCVWYHFDRFSDDPSEYSTN